MALTERALGRTLRPCSNVPHWRLTVSYQANAALDRLVAGLGPDARVLDVGGWYAPYPLATHVVDVMPYETRAQGYHPEPRAGERFTRATWVQADVTDPEFRLPFPDGFFAFSVCMHTLEDLHEVRPLVRELNRVSTAGYVETPSRLMEQTAGVSDRESTRVGFNHHKWIVDADGDRLVLHDKAESFYQPRKHYVVPLKYFERASGSHVQRHHWRGRLVVEIRTDHARSRRAARDYRAGLGVPAWTVATDAALRLARRLRSRMRGNTSFPDADRPADGGATPQLRGAA